MPPQRPYARVALMKKQRIVVGMSGGVDSSVAAFLLKEQGHQVMGLFMKNWEEWDGQGACSASRDYADVLRVCDQMDIECHQVNLSKQYWQQVFGRFLSDCKRGLTPNPDVLCNREIKFKAFFDHALQLGAERVATGHYCQIDHALPFPRLQKAFDANKDQSYFLQAITEKALAKTLFPLGHLKKPRVREIARAHGLHTCDKKDSMGICFVGKRPFAGLVGDYLHQNPGIIQTLGGEQVGQHRGLACYTIGQRRGLGLGGEGEPWFVVDKDLANNTLIVERGTDHPALYTEHLWAQEISWINPASREHFRPRQSYKLQAKIRYRGKAQDCQLLLDENAGAQVHFMGPQRAVTPGQYVCFYQGDICLGGGQITLR